MSEATANDAFQAVELDGDKVHLHNFSICNPDIAAFVRQQADADREAAIVHALEVGVFCLERASAAKDTEFIKRHVERLLTETEAKVAAIPVAVQAELLKKVGTGDGQVLRPLVDATGQVAKSLGDKIVEVKQLFGDSLDPGKDSTSLGKALKALNELLDPQRKDSVQGAVEAAVSKVTGEDGALAKAVKLVVGEAIKPLKDEVDSLAKEIRGQEAAQEALMQTTEKGAPFEEEIVAALQPWAKSVGAHIDYVGTDNKPGDITITLTDTAIAATDLRIVVETRDRQTAVGRKAIAEDLSKKMIERTAQAGIYLSRSAAGLGQQIGDWAEGECDSGPWVATTPAHLHTAVRLLIVLLRLRARGTEAAELDGAQLASQMQRIRTAIDRVKNIRRKANDVRSSADEISGQADSLRDEVRDALTAIEETLRNAGTPAS